MRTSSGGVGMASKPTDEAILLKVLSSCSRSGTSEVCQLPYCIVQCNQILWTIGLYLREDPHDAPGEVRLESLPWRWYDKKAYSKQPVIRSEAGLDLVRKLLTEHGCLVAVTLNDVVLREATLINSLRRISNVRTLTIITDLTLDDNNVCGIYKLFSKTETLDLPPKRLDGASEKAGCLTAVKFHPLRVLTTEAEKFIASLMSSSITVLSVTYSVVMGGGEMGSPETFARYLVHGDGILRKLVLKGCLVYDDRSLEILIATIASLKSLKELEADVCQGHQMILFSEVVVKNRSISSLKLMPSEQCFGIGSVYCELRPPGPRSSLLPRFSSALRMNSTLTLLHVNLSWFRLCDCCDFLRTVAQHGSLSYVIIGSLPEGSYVGEIRSIIQELSLSKKVLIKNHVLSLEEVLLSAQCPRVKGLTIDFERFLLTKLGRTVLSSFLATCDHITSLSVFVNAVCFKHMVSPLAAYIAKAAVLSELQCHVDFNFPFTPNTLLTYYSSYRPLLIAFNINRSLSRIAFSDVELTSSECQLLACAALQSTRLTELELTFRFGCFNSSFLRHLAEGVESNYSLLSITLPVSYWPADTEDECLFCNGTEPVEAVPLYHYHGMPHPTRPAILDVVTSRNASLLTRAARFTMGNCDYYNARALELVSEHPRLVEIIKKLALVEAAQAASMVRDALRRLHFASLDEFMKQAGVVRKRVQHTDGCNAGATNLSDLNEYCWHYIRKYLRLADVASWEGW